MQLPIELYARKNRGMGAVGLATVESRIWLACSSIRERGVYLSIGFHENQISLSKREFQVRLEFLFLLVARHLHQVNGALDVSNHQDMAFSLRDVSNAAS